MGAWFSRTSLQKPRNYAMAGQAYKRSSGRSGDVGRRVGAAGRELAIREVVSIRSIPRLAFQQLLDAALELALFQLALAQPFRKVGAGQFVRGFRTERDTYEIVAPPDDLGEKGTTLSRDRQQNRILR